MNLPIIDTHCDLLAYLAKVPGAAADRSGDIPCAIPLLQAGNVKLQVCAMFTDGSPGSPAIAAKQAACYREVLERFAGEVCQADAAFLAEINADSPVGLVAAIESAAGLADVGEPVEQAFPRLEALISATGRIAYISLTHHLENRFGGGNFSEGVGLKDDGRRILDFIAGRRIAIDLSHTSDLLAEGILKHIDDNGLDIPVMASHSNFRTAWDHKRNLTDEFVREILRRDGFIGVNFVRSFLNDDDPDGILDHIRYGFAIGAGENLGFGADFFDIKNFRDKSRVPVYFPNVEDASKYPALLDRLAESLTVDQLENLAHRNAQRFFARLWA